MFLVGLAISTKNKLGNSRLLWDEELFIPLFILNYINCFKKGIVLFTFLLNMCKLVIFLSDN